MSEFDVVIIHPPSVTYFWKKPFLPGPIHRTVSIYTPLFIMFPIGMISMASYLEERGIKVKVINLAEKLLVDKNLDLLKFLKGVKSEIYGVGLHWVVHTHGAIEVAKMCKRLHPDSIVVLGGFTATCLADEIVREFDFIDCVIRGEGEYPLFCLATNIKKFEKFKAFTKTPNLTFKATDDKIVSTTAVEHVLNDLDSLNFTRLDLVEPHERTITSPLTGSKLWNLPFYRGCMFNCATCGGSKFTYGSLMNRSMVAPRSPEKLMEDFMILDEMGIRSIFLFMDPRVCGRPYLDRLFKVFKGAAKWSNIKNVGIECFFPASKSYLEEWKSCKIADNIGFSISPESASEQIRYTHGRIYTTDQLIKTVSFAKELGLPIGVFFLLVLGHETRETLREMILLWEKLLSLNNNTKTISVDFSPMIFLDPCSPAFYNPAKYGYKLIFRKLIDYYKAMNLPHWSHWISYETQSFTRTDIVKIILEMWENLEIIKWKLGLVTKEQKELEKFIIDFERAAFKDIMEASITSTQKLEELAAEILEISKDPLISKSYVLTHDLSDMYLNILP